MSSVHWVAGNARLRVKTTVRKLLYSLYSGGAHKPDMSCIVGRVKYLSQEKLKNFGNNIYSKGSLKKENLFKSLLVKRKAFSHEREVRVLYYDMKRNVEGKVFNYRLNPHELVEQLMVDPRLSVKDANKFKAKIKTITGYKGKIKRSLLYSAPEQIILRDKNA